MTPDDWREVCGREGGPVCDEDVHCSTCNCPGLVADERDRLARFALTLAGSILNIPMTSDLEGLIARLWEESAK